MFGHRPQTLVIRLAFLSTLVLISAGLTQEAVSATALGSGPKFNFFFFCIFGLHVEIICNIMLKF